LQSPAQADWLCDGEIERHNINNGNRKEFGANRLTRASIAPGFGVGDAAEVNDNAQGVGNRI
jgi:hypothetical protein